MCIIIWGGRNINHSTSQVYYAIYSLQIFLQGQVLLYNDKVLLALPYHTELVLNTFWKILLKLCPKEFTIYSNTLNKSTWDWSEIICSFYFLHSCFGTVCLSGSTLILWHATQKYVTANIDLTKC